MQTKMLDVAILHSTVIFCVGTMAYYVVLGIGRRDLAKLLRFTVVILLVTTIVPALLGFVIGIRDGMVAFAERIENIVNALTFWR